MSKGTFIVVGGPAGTGKTTIASLLSEQLGCPYLEGDDLHPQENVDKMASGQPLTDTDRWGWLSILSKNTSTLVLDEENISNTTIVSCSMLKKIYREFIKKEANKSEELKFIFIFLYTSFEELLIRVGNRKNHYMKSDMVKSQYDIMEIPKDDELVINGGESIAVDTSDKSPQQIFEEIKQYL